MRDPLPRIDQLVAQARERLARVHPADLSAEVEAGAVVVDIRPAEQRLQYGELPGATVIRRDVLEWRLDPTSPYRADLPVDAETRVILVCQQGYSSSLAAASLQDLGLSRATDLIGGFAEWSKTRGLVEGQ